MKFAIAYCYFLLPLLRVIAIAYSIALQAGFGRGAPRSPKWGRSGRGPSGRGSSILYYIISHYITLYYVMLSYIIWYYVMLCYLMSYSLMLYYIKLCFATCSFCNIFFATSVLQYIFCNMFLSFPLLSLLSFPSRSFPSPVLPFPFPSLPFPFLSFPFLPLLYKAATATAHGATKNNGKHIFEIKT